MIILTIMKNFILVSVNCFLLYLAISFIIDVITEQDIKNRNITNKNKIKKINKEKKQKKKLSKIIISIIVVILMVLNISSEYYKYNVTKQQQEQKKIEQEKQQKEKEKEEQERLLKEKKEENQRLLEKQKESLKQAKQEYSKYILEYKNDSYNDIDDMNYYLYDYNLVITKDDTNRTVTFNLVDSDTNKIVETYTKEYNKKDLS